MAGRAIAAAALALALVACAEAPMPGGPIALCSAQSGLTLRAAKAQMAGMDGPVAATAEESRQINACLVGAGAPALQREVTVSVPTPEREGASVLSEGAGYYGSSLVEVTIAPADAAPASYVKPAAGKLPLPESYPLLPGDAELWATLTREQQERALLFLQDGSTIRASLRSD
ncbi:hypothetical protein OEW28_15940 [Defluviimonas sp. WL0002]|uniref:Uncharacterized protein n=1 Tax=Albidovulum marisflavi TaxID=2984159 RepID=A0ABT2ZHA6_9RHOB|nr:hypothetical protein [Defluviimonas sp. WL0002]MCV2870121.1 hypothetical protein [Defluviimonas sp. WL0002]